MTVPRFFSYTYGPGRRIGCRVTPEDPPFDFSRLWNLWVEATHQSLPALPDLDDLLHRGLFLPELISDCLKYRERIPQPDRDTLVIPGEIRYREPLAHPPKILCVTRNYQDHAAEMGGDIPPIPRFFAKLPSSLIGHEHPIELPADGRVDHEAELAVIIGRCARHLPDDDENAALACVAGYTILNDITHRDQQTEAKRSGLPWTASKSVDTFCPMGPDVVMARDLDPRDLHIRCWVGDDLRQDGNTANMVFSIPQLLVAITQTCTLNPGDIIGTGTPAGVSPLEPGATVSIEIEGIGRLDNPCALAKA